MKKIGLLALAIVLALGTMGAGFAYWTETLTIEDTNLETGMFNVSFDYNSLQKGIISNDDSDATQTMWCNGEYNTPVNPAPDDDGGDPTAHQVMQTPVNRIEDLASTTVSMPDPNTLTATVTITGAYPSYYPTVFFTIRNWGTIPAKVQSITVIEVSKDGAKIPVNIPLVVDTTVGLDCDNDTITDLELQLSDDYPDRLFQVIMEGGGVVGQHGHYLSAVCGDLGIHIADGVEENQSYDFTVEIVVVPFNCAG